MHKNMSGISWVIAVSLVLILTAGIASAATETYKISFSAKLTDAAGNPLAGTHAVSFRLYNVATGGTALATDTHDVTAAAGGQFTTGLTFPASNYNGQQLYVSLQRSPDPEKTPRTTIYPVPYALGLRPGATIAGNGTSPLLRIFKPDNGGMGLSVITSGSNSPAISAFTSSDTSNAVWGSTTGNGPAAVAGLTSGLNSPGVYGKTEANGSAGVYGLSTWDIGVYGKGVWGGKFETNQAGIGSFIPNGIWVNAPYNNNRGIIVTTRGSTSPGVVAETIGSNSPAIRASTTSGSSNAVYGYTSGNGPAAIAGVTAGTGSPGLYAYTTGANSNGVHAYSARGNGIYAEAGPSGGYAALLKGNVNVLSKTSGASVLELGEGLDYSEGFDLSGKDTITPGTVLIISPDDPGTLTISSGPYDRKVAGIVAGANGLGSAVKVGGDRFDANVALAGRVYCNVDATYGAVEPGDQLTTSATPGYAMVVQDYSRAQGATIGKAMERLKEGQKGQILVLVTLQ
jgi:hypothetical protein